MIGPTGALGLNLTSEALLVNADVARVAAGGFGQIVERDSAGWPGPGDRSARASERPGEGSADVVAVIVLTLRFSLIAVGSLIDADVLVPAQRRLCEVVEFDAGGWPLGMGERDAKRDESKRGDKQRRGASGSHTHAGRLRCADQRHCSTALLCHAAHPHGMCNRSASSRREEVYIPEWRQWDGVGGCAVRLATGRM